MRRISVIIPCYNVGLYIDRCLTSIAVQTIGFDSLEVICIDDASTDDTWEHLQKWEQRFPENVLLIRQEENRRQGAARNLGLQYASAEWVAFVDADDWLEPDHFEQMYRPVSREELDLVCCDFIRDSSETISYLDKNAGASKIEQDQFIVTDTEEIKEWMIRNKGALASPLGMLIRKNVLLEHQISFPEDLVYEDRFWGPMLFIYIRGVYFIKKKLYHYFLNPRSTTHLDDTDLLVDWITIQLVKWEEYERRGFLQTYREALEYDALLDAVRIMLLLCRYERPSFSLYRLERQVITGCVPSHRAEHHFTDFEGIPRSLLEALYSPLDKAGFQQFHQTIKQMKQLLKGLQDCVMYGNGEDR